jgi:hypothetical protein
MIVLAAIVLAVAMSGLSVASTDPGEDEISAGSSIAGKRLLALGKARTAAASRRVRGVIGRGRSTGPGRKSGLKAPPASAPSLVTVAPASASTPEPSTGAPATPGLEETADPPAVPVPPSAPAPAPPPPPAPPAATPPPSSPPAPSPPPKTSTPDIDPGVPLEPNPTPVTPGGLVLGIDGGYAGWSDAEVEHRIALGAAVTRHEWDPWEPIDEQDDVVETAAGEIHTRLHALLGGNELGDAAHYSDWAVGFVLRYGPGGSFWTEHPELDESRYAITTIELGNEPYFGGMSPQEYTDTVRPTLERIRDLGLPVKVLLPAYLHGTNLTWVDSLYERIPNLNSLYDALAFHPYWYGHAPSTPGDGGPLERIETLRQRMNELGADSKPIYLTEYGESTASCGGECVSEAVQAEHLQEMIEAVVSHPGWNVGMLSLFQLIDRGTNSGDRELQFGLLRQDGTPKPAYGIVSAAMQLYR